MIGAWLYTKNMRAAFAHFSRHDLESFSKPWSENVVFLYPPGTPLASGRIEGKKAMKEWIRTYMSHFPKIQFTVKSVGVERPFGLTSNVVSTEWDVSITNRNGESFSYGGVTVVRVENTKVVLVTDYIFDTAVLTQALGGLEAPIGTSIPAK